MSDTPTITLSGITKQTGVAGQIAYSVTVTYENEEPYDVRFIGSVYGGPVVMETNGRQTFVTNPDRFGDFSEKPVEWVRKFFA